MWKKSVGCICLFAFAALWIISPGFTDDKSTRAQKIIVRQDGDCPGMWIENDDGTLAVIAKSPGIPFPYVEVYVGRSVGKTLPYAMRFEEDTGELCLQIPGETPAKGRLIRMKHIVELVDASMKVRHAGEFWSNDNQRFKRKEQ